MSPRENCRNWPRAVFFNGAKTAKKALVDALDTLVAEGFEPGQIVVLSRRSAGNCLGASVDSPPWSDRLKPLATVAHEDWRDELPWAAMDGMGLDVPRASVAG